MLIGPRTAARTWPAPSGLPALPVARAATVAMLAFSLIAGALLFHLNMGAPGPAVEDRYGDAVRQGQLARGMAWLHDALDSGAAADRTPAPACSPGSDAERFDCLLGALNRQLARTDPPAHLNAKVPAADALPDLLATMRWLLRYSGTPANLRALLLRGEDAAEQSLADPFRLSGCIALATGGAPCGAASAVDLRQLLPQSGDLLNVLRRYAAPTRGASPNVQHLAAAPGLDTPITQGRHIRIGLDPALQDRAQTTAACYAGDAAACAACHWCNTGAAADMYEQARVRALGILVLDARSGVIEAAASATTGCYRQQQLGAPAGPGCPQLPNERVPHLDRLGNQALEQTAKPGSITKIVIALGLQRAGISAAESAQLPRILTYSRTDELIDIAMCRSHGFDPDCARQRLLAVAETATALGWDAHADLLGAGQVQGLSAPRFTARLLSQPDGVRLVSRTRALRLSQGALQACSRQQWRRCQGRDLVDAVAELFGTGEALASPLGVGNALLHLAAAANGQNAVAQPHLLAAAQDAAGQDIHVAPRLAPVLQASAIAPVLLGLQGTATQGTARSACVAAAAVFPGSLLPCAVPAAGPRINPPEQRALLRIAGKTGTPVFSADQGEIRSLTLPAWRSQCERTRRDLSALRKSSPRWYTLANEVGKCNMVPTKWYALLVGAPGGEGWDKVVVVLAERNWNRRTDRIDSPNDNGPNVAAESALALVNALHPPAAPATLARLSPSPSEP